MRTAFHLTLLIASLAFAPVATASTRTIAVDKAPRVTALGLPLGLGGDFDGDGRADLLGVTKTDLRVLTGAKGKLGRGFTVTKPENNGYEGPIESGGVGDVNGDGIDDVAVAESLASRNGRERSGSLHIVFGTKRRDTVGLTEPLGPRGFRIDGSVTGGALGDSEAPVPAGDFDGDGVGDVLVHDAGNRSWWVVLGARTAADVDLADPGARAISITLPDTGGESGSTAAGVGDVNGDGRDDIALGAAGIGGNKGAVFVVFGRAGIDAVDLTQPLGEGAVRIDGVESGRHCCAGPRGDAGDLVGDGVAAAGDMNRDGLADVVIAAPGLDVLGRRDAGGLVVMHGSRTLRSTDLDAVRRRGLTVAGPRREHQIALVASSPVVRVITPAGDLNGDRVPDIALLNQDDLVGDGAPASVYVIYGRRGKSVADLNDLGSGGYRLYGRERRRGRPAGLYALATPGDVDGDKRPDVAVTLRDGTHLVSCRTRCR